MDEVKKKRGLHPVWFFILLSFFTVLLSFIFSLINLQGIEYQVNQNGAVTTTILTVKSLLTLSGLKYILGETINNFLKFVPLGTVVIGLIGMGSLIKTGLLKEVFSRIAKRIPRVVMFFIFSLLCIVMGFSQDLAFVIMIPVAVALFTEYKRSQVIGMTMAFVSVAAGANINLFITSIDYSIVEIARNSVKTINMDYTYGYTGDLFLIVVSTLLLALLIALITEFVSRKKPVRISDDDLVIDEKLKKKGLRAAVIVVAIVAALSVYAIIPRLPLSGALLDNKQELYVNMIFGANSPFVNGILFIISFTGLIASIVYGYITKQIQTDKDVIKILTSNLNNIGELLLIIFFASAFIALFKYSNIGNVLVAILFGIIRDANFSFVLLIIFSFIAIILSGIFVSSFADKWEMFAPALMSQFMKSNITPAFTGAIFRLASGISNIVTPVFPYFAVYVGYMGLYNKNDFSVKKCYGLLMPYLIGIIILFLFIIISWYVLGAPIGPKINPTI
ncbi:MAG: AbgT family transporter [Bacilli bacterium]|nr:AbgT family transporter [Bacilli bacterium]